MIVLAALSPATVRTPVAGSNDAVTEKSLRLSSASKWFPNMMRSPIAAGGGCIARRGAVPLFARPAGGRAGGCRRVAPKPGGGYRAPPAPPVGGGGGFLGGGRGGGGGGG